MISPLNLGDADDMHVRTRLGQAFQYFTFANHVISGHLASSLTPFLLHLPDFYWGVLAYQNLYYLHHISIYHLYYISYLSYQFSGAVKSG